MNKMAKLWLAVIGITFSVNAMAAGSIIAAVVFELAVGTFAYAATAFAINMVISAVITKAFFTPEQPGGGADGLAGSSPNPGNRQQVPPASDNKLPVVYGRAFLGGTVTDLSITANNQQLFYVLSICEVTNNGADTITFGNIYWGGKRVIFNGIGPQVDSLYDESTGLYDYGPQGGYLKIYLYNNGSLSPVNSGSTAVQVMQTGGLTYQWNSAKAMTNTAFAIVEIVYNPSANLTGLQPTKFEVTNSRYAPGDCFYDYLTNDVYGAAIPANQIDTASLTALNTYSAGSFAYTNSSGGSATQARFRFDGVLDTSQSIMSNLQSMASCCDCLLRYNEILGLWGVVVQSPTYTVAMALDDSNIISAIQISPSDIASSYNVIECKFPDSSAQDAFNSATFDLAQIDPSLLYPNEPVNKQSVSLPLVNNNVRAQYIATRFIKAGRDDLQVQLSINYQGLQLEAGDIVTITNANYGWTAKPFRIIKVTEEFTSDGTITVKLVLSEFNAAIYDDAPITQFQPAPNTGIGSPTTFGTVFAPTVGTQYPANPIPLFLVNVTSSSAGVTQYAEVWYSAFQTPTSAQLIFAGTTAVQPAGVPYAPSTALPPVSLANIPAGDWYFFTRMVNSIASSPYSSASALLRWRPTTFQYDERYLVVAYADSVTGTGFNLNPRNKSYFGLRNQNSVSPSANPADYNWYLADPTFGTAVYLTYANYGNRRFGFDSGFAIYAAGTGAFVPSQASIFDPRLWSALPDGTNYIDLDMGTGQVLSTGTTSVGTGEIAVTNSPDGRVVAALKPFLDFGTGIYQKTSTVAQLTIDIYGRVVGFEEPDAFYMTIQSFTATGGQTVFNVTRSAGYISGQCLVFENGCLLATSAYTDTGGATGTVTFGTGRTAGDTITIISFKSTNTTTGVYASFTRNDVTITSVSSYTPAFTLNSGYELLFLNGMVLYDQDYDIVGNTITNLPSLASGDLTAIQWTPNNLGTPAGDPVNQPLNAIIGQTVYSFSFTAGAFNLYANGVLLLQGSDYTTATGGYTLSNTPTTVDYVLLQQTFSRTGAV